MLLSKKLENDVRCYSMAEYKAVRNKYPNKKVKEINIIKFPAMVSSCCYRNTPIYHDKSHSTANVIFDVRLMKSFNVLGGKPGDIVDGCENQLGRCAEQRACNKLLKETYTITSKYSLDKVIFSWAYRPRTFTKHPMCYNCKRIFNK